MPQCSAHGLRKAFLRRMAEAGCSEDYIASISGHADMREIRTYVQAANRAQHGDRGHGADARAVPRDLTVNGVTAKPKEENCQTGAKPLMTQDLFTDLAGVEGLRTPNPRFWRPVL